MSQKLELKGLEKILKLLKDPKKPFIRVGILGSDATAKHEDKDGKAGLTNSQIGSAHEFGTTTLPVRSFLRMPLTEQFPKMLDASGAISKETLYEVVQAGSVQPWLEKVAIIAENAVTGAFDTGGYGAWAPSDMSNKTVHQTLVESQQLRNSITYEIKKGGN